jgi:hypothetical protein
VPHCQCNRPQSLPLFPGGDEVPADERRAE